MHGGVGRGSRRTARCGVLGLLLICAAGTGCRPAAPGASYAPLGGIDVQHYDVTLTLDPATRTLEGQVRVRVAHADTVSVLPLAMGALEVTAVRVDGRGVEVVRRPGRLVVPLAPGADTSVVEVDYGGVPEEGLYHAVHAAQPVVFTDSWPDRGRGWMPAVYHPSDPATFDLTLDLPPGYEAAASGTPQEVTPRGAVVRHRWRLRTPAPAYTFAFAVADFSVVPAGGDTLPVRFYMLAADSAQAAALARTPQMLAYFSALLGPYAFDQYASVQVPLQFAGMENAAAAFLQAALFAPGGGAQAEAVQVHEVAHQWFGNRVLPADWRDLWLSEGAATYLTTLFYESADGLAAARARWVEMAVLPPGPEKRAQPLVPPAVADPMQHLTWIPYRKGASVLHLLRRRLGDDVFFAALRSIYARHAGEPLSTEAFRRRLEDASGLDLAAIFDYWVYGTAFPVVETAWAPGTRTLTWAVRGDAGTLADVPYELEVRQGARRVYTPAAAGRLQLRGWTTDPPQVRPVGIMARVE